MNKILKILIIVLFSVSYLKAQSTEEWVNRYDGAGTDHSYSLATDNSGNIYTCGSVNNGNNSDYFVIKYSVTGKFIRSVYYNGTANGDDCAYAIAADKYNNIYVTGMSEGITGGLDFVTIKYNANGIQQWEARYNGTGNSTDAAYFIKIDENCNIYVAGQSYGTGSNFDCLIIKYNLSGVEQWVNRYNGTGNTSDVINDLIIDDNGNLYTAGATTNSSYNFDFLVLKLNNNGIIQWTNIYDDSSSNSDAANSLALDQWGNIYAAGSSTNTSFNADYLTVKYNPSGNVIWQNRFNGTGSGNDFAYSIAVSRNGDAYITGTSYCSENNFNYLTIKYNTDGLLSWIKNYDGNNNLLDEANHIVLDNDENVYITGFSTNFSSGSDFTTIKYNSSGMQQWIKTYDGTGNSSDQATSLTLDNSGNVYVTGSSTGIGTGLDFATVKYSQTMVGNANSNTRITNNFNLQQNYPNPFNPGTLIKFDIPAPGLNNSENIINTRLIIYDILGNQLEKLVDKPLTAGSHEIFWNASQYASGIYFYRLSVTGKSTILFEDTKKMILSK
ncbi:MAG: T9SS C-terminal target domain-containing protein [Ignavibacteriae bacterium]|nr:MAG: T9SS C-terminal target domain-containing protein [Ignavibacteriota bacterium]